MIADKPREKWRYILKKMCKIGVVDHEYIRHTCDMRWVTEEYLMDETERYIQRYDSQKMMNTNANTNAISSLDWSNRFSVSYTMTQQLEEEFKKLKDQIRMREEMKKFQDEQASFLLAQLLKFEEQCKLFEEERTQLTVEKARLVEEQIAIQEQNLKQSKELKEQRRLLEDKETQLAEAQQTILQMSTEKAQNTILSNKTNRRVLTIQNYRKIIF
jgi:hypothetical protein